MDSDEESELFLDNVDGELSITSDILYSTFHQNVSASLFALLPCPFDPTAVDETALHTALPSRPAELAVAAAESAVDVLEPEGEAEAAVPESLPAGTSSNEGLQARLGAAAAISSRSEGNGDNGSDGTAVGNSVDDMAVPAAELFGSSSSALAKKTLAKHAVWDRYTCHKTGTKGWARFESGYASEFMRNLAQTPGWWARAAVHHHHNFFHAPTALRCAAEATLQPYRLSWTQ